ncbi:MAG TPA: tripartite tricarboxylate transporter substrate binding protein [Thermodesulfobacteriota bacterium]|nr:tripartite tricarboxylate transporter substrate binding protein [Thermodesulfobacteriota bacterium]
MLRTATAFVAALLAFGLGLVAPAGTLAAAYPTKPIKVIVPWPAGGDTDVIARIQVGMAEKILGQPMVVTNITGASGTVGAREARNAPPDGYTILSVHDFIHTTYHVGVGNVSYRDFEPIALMTATYSILATHGKAKWKTFQEVIEDSKKRPGEITVGATLGSTSHFFPALVERAAGVKWKYVSYEGTAPRMTALLGGHIDLAESNLTQADKAKGGQLRFLAVASEQRLPEIPDVPTLRELGINVVYALNRGFLAPKGTPEEVLAKLEAAFEKVAKDPAFAAEMAKQGTQVRFLGRKAYAEFLRKNDAENAEIALALGYAKR